MPHSKSALAIWRFLLGCLFLLNLLNPASAVADDVNEALDPQLNERILYVPVQDSPQVRLQVTLFTPDGPGPFPLAILNHGKEPGSPKNEKRYRSVYAARYFLSRGYAVALPMMRGFAGSEGDTWVTGCDLERMAVRHAQDIAKVVQYLGSQPDLGIPIDANRVVIFGQSMGGWNTLAAGSLSIPGVKGLINFAGGLNAPACPAWQRDLPIATSHFGQHTSVPSIWFYGDNDSKFSTPLWRNMLEQYNAAGGKAEIVAYGSFMQDSHNFLGRIEALPVWMPKLDAFLERLGLPRDNLHPSLLPSPYPAPTRFANIDDINALPMVNDKGREEYKAFLKKDMPKVFAIATNGATVSTSGGYDPLERAMTACRQHNLQCQAYAVDNQVVWPKALTEPLAKSFAELTK